MVLPDPSRILPLSPRGTSMITSASARIVHGVSRLHPTARKIFLVALVLFIFSTVALILTLSDRFYVNVPARGGAIIEGIIDRPRFINPVLARTSADRNLTALVYSGLVRVTADGSIVPDLAESFTVSEDSLTYTFTLRPDLTWHDGFSVTSADVVYTIEKIRDPGLEIKSPRRISWEGVTVAAPDERTIVFTLKQPFAPFLENASVGILPKHIWGEIANSEFDVSYYNLDPIGTGPYRIAKIVQDDKKGLPLSYELKAFPGYALGEPYITTFTMRFFGNNKDLLQAYQDGTITQFPTVDPEVAAAIESSGGMITRMHLPLIDAAFFNQSQAPIFVDKKVRHALSLAIDKDRIVREVLYGYGIRADGPISALSAITAASSSLSTTTPYYDKSAALLLLEEAGYARDEESGIMTKTDKKTKKTTRLSFSITVPDVAELRHAAGIMKENWDSLGVQTSVKVFETGTFGGEVLVPRDYDVLVYGIIGKESDPYPYWHSSQRNAPGVNIANYTNRIADDLLEKIRRESDPVQRVEYLRKLEETIVDDTPAIFLYSPSFLYATDKKIHGIATTHVLVESDRFNEIYNWYIDVDRVWWFLEPYAKRTPKTESRISLALWKYFSESRI